LAVAPDYWSALVASGLYPDYPTIVKNLNAAGLGSSAPPAAALAAGLVAMCIETPGREVIDSWSSTGCLGTRPPASDEIVLAIADFDVPCLIAGSSTRDGESLKIRALWEDGTGIAIVGLDREVECFQSFDELLPALDPVAFRHDAVVALRIAIARLKSDGVTSEPRGCTILPTLREQLASADMGVARSAFGAMAQILRPKVDWPKGLDEHAIRTGESGNDPAHTSHLGTAMRITISKHGPGWRLHFWLGQEGITFANLAPHGSSFIADH
jgi:hypothetical protein